MDRRSWLWRRKSSEKSPGETESTGSFSSHSERFSDDQRSQSPGLTSKAATMEEDDVTADIKTLSEELSSALLNVSLKEELVKQHAKVAEEAVTGWEKAEKEVVALKQQLEASVSKNSALEDRIIHLDSALKECVRQLRQGREHQDEKIQEAVNKKCQEWETSKSELQTQVAELQARLLSAMEEAASSVYNNHNPKLEVLEKENSALKLQLISISEELELRTVERDLSTQAAESASKQQLESIKKLTMLEAECRKLKAMAQRSMSSRDLKFQSDNQFNSCEHDMGKKLFDPELNSTSPIAIAKTPSSPAVEISLMDDFLEMEKLASLPDSKLGSRHPETGKGSEKPNAQLRRELETSLRRVSDLEEKVELVEVEKLQLEMALDESRNQIIALKSQLRETEGKLSELEKLRARNQELETSISESEMQLEILQNQLTKAQVKSSELETAKAEKLELAFCLSGTKKQLETSQNQLRDAEKKMTELQTLLCLANDAREAAEDKVKAANIKTEAAESRLGEVEAEAKSLALKISSLEDSMEMERVLSSKHFAKCQELRDEISELKHEVELHREAGRCNVKGFDDDFKLKQEKELSVAAAKFAECQRTIASLGERLKSLATLEDFLLESEDPSNLTLLPRKNPDDGQLNPFEANSESSSRSGEHVSDSPRNRSHEELSLVSSQVDSSTRSRNGLEGFLNRNKSAR